MNMRWQPSLKIIPHYESDPLYVDALVNSINVKINNINWKPDLILASYHGIPKSYFDKGDPYHCYCHKTTRLVSEKFSSIKIKTTFQSRFGPQEWLQPYTDKTLENLPKEGVKNVLTICPGFSWCSKNDSVRSEVDSCRNTVVSESLTATAISL